MNIYETVVRKLYKVCEAFDRLKGTGKIAESSIEHMLTNTVVHIVLDNNKYEVHIGYIKPYTITIFHNQDNHYSPCCCFINFDGNVFHTERSEEKVFKVAIEMCKKNTKDIPLEELINFCDDLYMHVGLFEEINSVYFDPEYYEENYLTGL